MFRIHCKFTTDKGALNAGLVDEKEIKKHFKKDEIDGYIEQGLISKVEMPTDVPTEGNDDVDVEALIELPKEGLKVAELKRVCEYYKLSTTGNKDALIERIEHFETLLELDLEELEDDDLKLLANFSGVDMELDRDAMIDALEEKSE